MTELETATGRAYVANTIIGKRGVARTVAAIEAEVREPLAVEIVRLRAVEAAARESLAAEDAHEALLDRSTYTLTEMDNPEFRAMTKRLRAADRTLRTALSADAVETAT